MTEIFIEKKKLDITSELAYLLTFAVDDVRDFGSRNCTFSKTIVLPGTANNNYLFGHIFNVTISNPYDSNVDNVATNFNPSVNAECIAFNDRMQVFKGTIRLLEIIIDNGQVEYEVALFGELGGLVSSIGARKLEDLDFSAYDELWDVYNVTGSWENVTGGGVYYPLIDYGTVSTDKIYYDFRAFRPAFYVREYVKKIIEGAGYSWSSALMDTQRFKNLVVPNNQERLYNRQLIALSLIKSGGTYTGTVSELIQFSGAVIAGGFVGTSSNTVWTYTGDTITGTVHMELRINNITNASAPPYTFEILKNGVVVDTIYITLPTAPPGDIVSVDANISISTGDYISVRVVPPPFGSPSLEIGTSFLYLENSVAQPVQANYNDSIDMNSSIPRNVLQRDFLSNVLKLFNAYVYENKLDSKKLYIDPYVDYYDLNVSGVVDWTYKVDRSKPIRLRPMSELNSRYYYFKFKDDSDYYNELYRKTYNENYGDYAYDSAYEFANDKTDIQLIFSPTPLVGYVGVDKVVSAIYKLSAGVEEKTSSNIRILQAKKITGVASWSIKNGATVLHTGTFYGYAGHYDDPDAPANDIQFGVPKELYFTLVSGAVNVTQFNVYWSPYMAEITDKDSKLMTCYMKLNSSDIFNLDFSKLVYVDGSYWRLNKIVDWNVNEPDVCQVELLKVINLVY